MDISNCLRALSGSTDLVATRPTRTIIKVNHRLMIQVHGPRGWYRWCPAFGDLVAIDWEVLNQRQLAERIQAEMAELNGAAQSA